MTTHYTHISTGVWQTAFDGDAPKPLAGPGISIAVRPPMPMALVTAWPGTLSEVAAALEEQSYTLPLAPGEAVMGEAGGVVHSMAPGRWLVELADDRLPFLPAELGTITDLSHARTSFEFSGRDAVEFAQKLAPIDFSLPRNGPMRFVQSGSDHSTSFGLWRAAENRFILYVEQSFARDFWHTLEAECAEFRG